MPEFELETLDNSIATQPQANAEVWLSSVIWCDITSHFRQHWNPKIWVPFHIKASRDDKTWSYV